MGRKKLLLIIILLALTTLTCQCSRNIANISHGNDLPPEQRMEILTSISDFHDSLPADGDPEEGKQALIEYLRSLSEIKSAGLTQEGNIWGQFIDGRVLKLIEATPFPPEELILSNSNSPIPDPSSPHFANIHLSTNTYLTNYSLFDQSEISDIQMNNAGYSNLPESSKALVMSSLPQRMGGEWDLVRAYLELVNYDIGATIPSVDNLKMQVNDVGVFYFATHGMKADFVDDKGIIIPKPSIEDPEAKRAYAGFLTSTPMNTENDKAYADDLDNKRLTYAATYDTLGRGIVGIERYKPGKEPTGRELVWVYAITEKFIEKYMSFSENSFVYVSACHSYQDILVQAFVKKNATVYAGWTSYTYGREAILVPTYVFQLLLGVEGHLEAAEKTKHHYRSFDQVAIWDFLRKRGMDRIEKYDSSLKFYGNKKVILAPSIKWMDVSEIEKELHLIGAFGEVPGKVIIDDVEIPLVGAWHPDKLIVELPPIDSSNGYGEVSVVVSEHEGNPVDLTRWIGELSYTVEPLEIWAPGLQQKVVVEFMIRADVHPYREKPEDDPEYRDIVPFTIQDDLSGHWEFSGRGTNSACTDIELNGEGDLSVELEETGSQSYFGIWGDIYPEQKKLDVRLQLMVLPGAGGTMTTINTCGGGEHTLPQMLIIFDNLIQSIEMDMDQDFVIQEDKQTSDTVVGHNIGATGTVEWEKVIPDFPPEEDCYSLEFSEDKMVQLEPIMIY
jgi:hypothetical protein